jgi:hypothetical protein
LTFALYSPIILELEFGSILAFRGYYPAEMLPQICGGGEMREAQTVVRARRDGTGLPIPDLRKLGLPEDSYSFKEGEYGLLRMSVPCRRPWSHQDGLMIPMVLWDNAQIGRYVTVADCQFSTEVAGIQDGQNRRYLIPE